MFTRNHGLTIFLLMAMGIISIWFMHSVPFWGDEHHYLRVGKGVAAGLLGQSSSEEVAKSIIAQGWFTPGVGLLFAPLFLLTHLEPSLLATRVYAATLNLILLTAIVRELTLRFGPRSAQVFLAICLISPFYVSFLSGAWADILALHFVLLFLLWLDRRLAATNPVLALPAGTGLAALTYLRPLYWPMLALPVAAWIISALKQDEEPWRSTRNIAMKSLLMVIVFVVLLAPWSYSVSEIYGPTIFRTTSKISGIMWCISPDRNPYLPEGTERVSWGQLFFSTQRLANRNGVSFSEQARIETEKACEGVKRVGRLERNSLAIERYFAHPENFMRRFSRLRCEESKCLGKDSRENLLQATRINWFVLLTIGTLLSLIPFRQSSNGSYLLPVFLKATVCLVCMHPLVASAHSRYHVVLVPVFAMMTALVASGNFRIWRYDAAERSLSVLLAMGQTIPILLFSAILAFLSNSVPV